MLNLPESYLLTFLLLFCGSCSTPKDLHRAVFKALILLEEKLQPLPMPPPPPPPSGVGVSKQGGRKQSAKAIIASVVASFWEFIVKLAEPELVELEAKEKLVVLYNLWLEAAQGF